MTEHKQVEIKYKDKVANVDEGIADLILEMWKADIDPVMSCHVKKIVQGSYGFIS